MLRQGCGIAALALSVGCGTEDEGLHAVSAGSREAQAVEARIAAAAGPLHVSLRAKPTAEVGLPARASGPVRLRDLRSGLETRFWLEGAGEAPAEEVGGAIVY